MKPWSETEDWAWLQVSFDSPFWKENDSSLSRTAGCLHFLRVSMMLSKTTLYYQNACTQEEKHVELLGNHQTEEKHILGHPICNSLEPMCNGFPFRTTPQVRANCFIQLLQGAMGLIFHMENLWSAEEKCFQKATTQDHTYGVCDRRNFYWHLETLPERNMVIWHFSILLDYVYNWQNN